MTETDRRILTRACNLETEQYWWCEICNKELIPERVTFQETCVACGFPVILRGGLSTFSTPDDWEVVRTRVVAQNVEQFIYWFKGISLEVAFKTAECLLSMSCEDRCLLVCKWIKTRPDLFPWVKEMMEENNG